MSIVAFASVAVLSVVSFKDAAKIKSWDAWGDGGKTPTARAGGCDFTWLDLMTGRICNLRGFSSVPAWDAPFNRRLHNERQVI